MKKPLSLGAVVFCCAVGSVYAIWVVENRGTWPKNWPEQLEPLRKQSRSYTGGEFNQTQYEIPFTIRKDFESAWPHFLKIKSKGAPVLLMRGPHKYLGTLDAGVRIYCPPEADVKDVPSAQFTGPVNVRARWRSTTFVELVVDGDIIDMNRIPLPADTPIIDMRFNDNNIQ